MTGEDLWEMGVDDRREGRNMSSHGQICEGAKELQWMLSSRHNFEEVQ